MVLLTYSDVNRRRVARRVFIAVTASINKLHATSVNTIKNDELKLYRNLMQKSGADPDKQATISRQEREGCTCRNRTVLMNISTCLRWSSASSHG